MTLIGIPYFLGEASLQFEKDIDKIYSAQFLEKIFRRLGVSEPQKKNDFEKFLKSTAVSYLTAKDINAKRIQPNKQKDLFKKYASALENTRKLYNQIIEYNSTSSNYHDDIRDEIRITKIQGMDKMFDPYVTIGDGENSLGSTSTTLFDEFLGVLAEGARKAPDYIKEHDKADLSKEYILWWLHRIGSYWSDFTNVPFALGDWYKNEDFGIKESEGTKKKGLYYSEALDVLYELLVSVDEKITRADIETAMRKFKKM